MFSRRTLPLSGGPALRNSSGSFHEAPVHAEEEGEGDCASADVL